MAPLVYLYVCQRPFVWNYDVLSFKLVLFLEVNYFMSGLLVFSFELLILGPVIKD